MTVFDIKSCEKKLGVKFTDSKLLKQAFVHRSYLNENKNEVSDHNERLEFLGDAVLELVSTDFLYRKYPDKHEGILTAYRSGLVNAVYLSAVATKLGLEEFLLLSRGESKDKGKARQYILANTIEALIGAIYIDNGYDKAKKFIESYILADVENMVQSGDFIDSKSLFQEKAQEKTGITPLYKLVKEAGPDHDKVFYMAVYLGSEKVADGHGRSKQEAEQNAASEALKKRGW